MENSKTYNSVFSTSNHNYRQFGQISINSYLSSDTEQEFSNTSFDKLCVETMPELHSRCPTTATSNNCKPVKKRFKRKFRNVISSDSSSENEADRIGVNGSESNSPCNRGVISKAIGLMFSNNSSEDFVAKMSKSKEINSVNQHHFKLRKIEHEDSSNKSKKPNINLSCINANCSASKRQENSDASSNKSQDLSGVISSNIEKIPKWHQFQVETHSESSLAMFTNEGILNVTSEQVNKDQFEDGNLKDSASQIELDTSRHLFKKLKVCRVSQQSPDLFDNSDEPVSNEIKKIPSQFQGTDSEYVVTTNIYSPTNEKLNEKTKPNSKYFTNTSSNCEAVKTRSKRKCCNDAPSHSPENVAGDIAINGEKEKPSKIDTNICDITIDANSESHSHRNGEGVSQAVGLISSNNSSEAFATKMNRRKEINFDDQHQFKLRKIENKNSSSILKKPDINLLSTNNNCRASRGEQNSDVSSNTSPNLKKSDTKSKRSQQMQSMSNQITVEVMVHETALKSKKLNIANGNSTGIIAAESSRNDCLFETAEGCLNENNPSTISKIVQSDVRSIDDDDELYADVSLNISEFTQLGERDDLTNNANNSPINVNNYDGDVEDNEDYNNNIRNGFVEKNFANSSSMLSQEKQTNLEDIQEISNHVQTQNKSYLNEPSPMLCRWRKNMKTAYIDSAVDQSDPKDQANRTKEDQPDIYQILATNQISQPIDDNNSIQETDMTKQRSNNISAYESSGGDSFFNELFRPNKKKTNEQEKKNDEKQPAKKRRKRKLYNPNDHEYLKSINLEDDKLDKYFALSEADKLEHNRRISELILEENRNRKKSRKLKSVKKKNEKRLKNKPGTIEGPVAPEEQQ